EKAFKALLPTFKAGELDFGVVIRGPAADKSYTLVGGLKVKDGDALDKTVRELTADQPEDKRKDVHFDAAKVGAVAIHRLELPNTPEEKGKSPFGREVYFAFRPDALVFAVGGDALGAVKEAVALPPRPGKPLLLEMATARMVPLMEKDSPGAAKAAE